MPLRLWLSAVCCMRGMSRPLQRHKELNRSKKVCASPDRRSQTEIKQVFCHLLPRFCLIILMTELKKFLIWMKKKFLPNLVASRHKWHKQGPISKLNLLARRVSYLAKISKTNHLHHLMEMVLTMKTLMMMMSPLTIVSSQTIRIRLKCLLLRLKEAQ